jgi:hypothetical protein
MDERPPRDDQRARDPHRVAVGTSDTLSVVRQRGGFFGPPDRREQIHQRGGIDHTGEAGLVGEIGVDLDRVL